MTVGVTGHQDLGGPKAASWVKQAVEHAILEQNVTLGITSLAVGADQLYATVLLKAGKPFTAIIPCENYISAFDDSGAEDYAQLLNQAKKIETLDFPQPSEEAFWAAGRRVVELSDTLIAVWNGEKAKGLGGTGDVVEYALERGATIIHLNPVTKNVEVHSGK